jgi:cytochrome c oxidase subunit 2
MTDLLRMLLFLPPAATENAREIDLLHYFVISVTFAGAFSVLGAACWFAIRYRRRHEGDRPPQVKAPAWLEWGVAAFLLVLFLGWWVIGFRQYIDLQRPPENALSIYVLAKQWMWKFAYPDGRSTNGYLVVPRDRPVRLVMTSRDVIHSFYVPAFRVKQDVIPGQYVLLWFEADEPGV